MFYTRMLTSCLLSLAITAMFCPSHSDSNASNGDNEKPLDENGVKSSHRRLISLQRLRTPKNDPKTVESKGYICSKGRVVQMLAVMDFFMPSPFGWYCARQNP